MDALTSKQRKQLKGLAHHLEPVVHVGKGRITDRLISELDRTLGAHELIKVKIDAEGSERKDLALSLASASRSHLVTTVGKIAILYRENADDPQIELD